QVAPAVTAAAASAGSVTVIHTLLPAARRSATIAGSGQPNVKLTIGTGQAIRSAIFACQSSSSQEASPTSVPSAAASTAMLSRYRATTCESAGAPGTKTLTPNGSLVTAVRASISARIVLADLYPAGTNPTAPACAAAAISFVVVVPPAIGATMMGRLIRSLNILSGTIRIVAR